MMRKLCRSLVILQKVSLAGLVALLLFLSWSPQQLQTIQRKSGILEDNDLLMEDVAANLDKFISRQSALEKQCVEANLTEIKPPRTLIYSKKLHLAYCPLPLVASTSFKYAMVISEGKRITSHKLYNVSLQQAIHSDAQKLALRSAPEKVNGQVDVLLIVRNPWQRLIAMYKKYVENGKNNSFHVRSCQRLLEVGPDHKVNFDQFLECILKAVELKDKFALHVQPASVRCSICRIKYTRIVKFEDISSELNILFAPSKKSPLNSNLLDAFQKCPITKSSPYHILPYLQLTTERLRHKIQELYLQDFEAFGYPLLKELL